MKQCENRSQWFRELHYCNNKQYCKNQFNYGYEKFCKLPLIKEAERKQNIERIIEANKFEEKGE